MAEDYADLSDDDLIDLLVAKTRASHRVQPATDTNGRGLASRPGRKQDDAVKTPAKVVDSRDASIRSLIGLRPEPKVHLQTDFLAKLETHGKIVPELSRKDARRRTQLAVLAQDPKQWLGKEISSVDDLCSVALELTREEHYLPTATRVLMDRFREELLAGGDPLGECYTGLRSAQARRGAGITLTPLRIVDSMLRWVTAQIASGRAPPARIVDPGSGTGRFAIAAARKFPEAQVIAVENDPEIALLLRANLHALDLSSRVRVITSDFRAVELPAIDGPTLFVGNPPYVRHHKISRAWKEWYSGVCKRRGVSASQLAGSHLHFFAKVVEISRKGDYGCFITAAEWLDVGYGSALRALLANGLGGAEVHVLEPTAEAFPGTMSTAAITAFFVGERPDALAISRVAMPADLDHLEAGRSVPWERAEATPRWSVLVRNEPTPPEGLVELGELCRVHRGQVTGANKIWIAAAHSRGLPSCVLKSTVTSADQIIGAGSILDSDSRLSRVIDLPIDLDALAPTERIAVERFIKWAKSAGAADGYIATHRTPWWAIRLAEPAPIVCTYMARRAPAFARNRAGARLLNIAHGIYPRDDLSEEQLMALVAILRATVSQSQGRTYAGGLTKFEPRELERVLIPWANTLT
jgi:SAM-dependent methyltransferase